MKHPWEYTKNNINEILNIYLLIKFKDRSTNKLREVKGFSTYCLLSSNEPHEPVYLVIKLLNSLEEKVYFIDMELIEVL